MNTLEKVITAFAEEMCVSAITISHQDSLAEIHGMDSLDVIDFTTALEHNFDIDISDTHQKAITTPESTAIMIDKILAENSKYQTDHIPSPPPTTTQEKFARLA